MKSLKIIRLSLIFALTALSICGCIDRYPYQEVAGDPLQARIYTLDNGLKVYMTVNKEKPRIQTYIAVRVGSKYDPSETTGLAHYFEHLMFKGTSAFGTLDYAAEKPLLDEIERLFEIYRRTTDPGERKALYAQIDSISYEASKIAIPNEYDKLMAAIGAKGTNAYTSYDQTVYTEDIPSNQIENWAKIQANRFSDNVIRLFHTELETVYEEYNMSLTNDNSKVLNKALQMAYPHHPYGTQTVLGTQENLKNPSITNIKNYYKTYYVPNNMAICLSGDFDPNRTIAIIDKYFGDLKPNPDIPELQLEPGEGPQEICSGEVMSVETPFVNMIWTVPGLESEERELISITTSLLSNGKAGLMDLNLNQAQKVLGVGGGYLALADAGGVFYSGYPKQGQSLEEVRDCILEQVAKVRAGEFDSGLLEAIVANYKLSLMQSLESNDSRAQQFVTAFIAGIPWERSVQSLSRLESITKEDVVAFANRYLRDDNYIVIYKLQGEDKNIKKIEKPDITPIFTNRDTASVFLTEIQNSKPAPIEPVFVDFDQAITRKEVFKDVTLRYVPNRINDIFTLSFVYDFGSNVNNLFSTAFSYMEYLGTPDMSAAEIQIAFYDLACNYSFQSGTDRSVITLSGLSEKMPQALKLLEHLINEALPDTGVYNNLVSDILKSREMGKTMQNTNFAMLQTYAFYGEESPAKNIPTAKELKALNPRTLTELVKSVNQYPHIITYYGPEDIDGVIATLKEEHHIAQTLQPNPQGKTFTEQYTQGNRVYLAQYDAKQIYMAGVSIRENEKFDPSIYPVMSLYNEYFGGGMNSIVFQEMREARGLAYTAQAFLNAPSRLDRHYAMISFIATQNDKMIESMDTFDQIINQMPESEAAFAIAKEGLTTRLRTERITGKNILNAYQSNLDLGLTSDPRKALYEALPNLTLRDIKAFQEKWVKGRTYTYCILGDANDLDLNGLLKYGPIKKLSQKDLFGY